MAADDRGTAEADRVERDREIILKIEDVRRTNNRCWMDILALAVKVAPREAKDILRKIDQNDRKISELMWRLAQ